MIFDYDLTTKAQKALILRGKMVVGNWIFRLRPLTTNYYEKSNINIQKYLALAK